MEEIRKVALNLFFLLESYHFATHTFVLFRVRLLPRKDLVRTRYYFLIDTTCVFIVNFILLQRLRPVAAVQIVQHLFYYITWEKSELSKKVIIYFATLSLIAWYRIICVIVL